MEPGRQERPVRHGLDGFKPVVDSLFFPLGLFPLGLRDPSLVVAFLPVEFDKLGHQRPGFPPADVP
jgi:hypothetical protein